jgi:hypothetical protein
LWPCDDSLCQRRARIRALMRRVGESEPPNTTRRAPLQTAGCPFGYLLGICVVGLGSWLLGAVVGTKSLVPVRSEFNFISSIVSPRGGSEESNIHSVRAAPPMNTLYPNHFSGHA